MSHARNKHKAFADFLMQIRLFMQNEDICEVITNPVSQRVVPDRGVDPVAINLSIGKYYLHTSPEWEMKKLLAQGSGSIYQMVSVFRDDVAQNWHKPAFLMLEWYVVGQNDIGLIEQCLALFKSVGIDETPQVLSFYQVYQKYCGLDIRHIDIASLRAYCKQKGARVEALEDPDDISSWLTYIWASDIEPRLKGLVVVKDFHPSQCALARVIEEPYPHAKRFEIYLNGCELANGYDENTNIEELAQRFSEDAREHPVVNAKDIESMPACAGVSIGIDRLYAQIIGRESL